MIEQEYKYKPTDWQSFFVGLFVGFILTLIILWFSVKKDNPDDWCNQLLNSDAKYCHTLYDKSVKRQKDFQEKYGNPMDSADRPLE